VSSFLETIRNTFTKSYPLRWTTIPWGGIPIVSRGIFFVLSGFSKRFDFNLVKKCHCFFLIALRFFYACILYIKHDKLWFKSAFIWPCQAYQENDHSWFFRLHRCYRYGNQQVIFCCRLSRASLQDQFPLTNFLTSSHKGSVSEGYFWRRRIKQSWERVSCRRVTASSLTKLKTVDVAIRKLM